MKSSKFLYVATGAVFVFFATEFTGCKVGNYESPTPAPTDQFYGTQPYSFTLHAGSGSSVQGSLSNLPTDAADYFPDPIEVITIDQGSGSSIAVTPGSTVGEFPLTINPTSGAISGTFATSTNGAFWPDANGNGLPCEYSLSYSIAGNTTIGTSGQTAETGIGDVTLSGNLGFELTSTAQFQGLNADGSGCASVLTAMYNCYEQTQQCPGGGSEPSYQLFVHQVFDVYITNGAMTAAEIASTSSMGYELSFH